MFNTAIKKAKV